jgi:hypothetical protein
MKTIIHTLFVFAAALFACFAAEKNDIPPDLAKALADAKEATLFSIEPMGGKNPKAGFHGYPILGQAMLQGKDLDGAIAEFLNAVKHFDGESARCFNPRHGLRVKSQGATFDIVICFECSIYHVHKGGRQVSTGGLTGTGKAMNAILTAARVKLAPAAK